MTEEEARWKIMPKNDQQLPLNIKPQDFSLVYLGLINKTS